MSGTGTVLQAEVVDYPPEDHRQVVQLLTDALGPANAVYIESTGPRPLDGTPISWGPHHVWWNDRLGQPQRVSKVGLEFDARAGWTYSCPVDRPVDPARGS